MMKTENLTKFLKSAKVDKENQFCIVNVDGDQLVAKSTNEDNSLITKVTLNETFPLSEKIVIKDIDRLIKILGLHDEEIDIKMKDGKMIITDKATKSECVTANPDFFKTKRTNFSPTVEGELILDEDTLRKMVHAMKVLSEGDSIAILLQDVRSTVSVGTANNYTNKITFEVPSKKSDINSISNLFYLNLQIVKQILETHIGCKEARLIIPKESAVKFEFKYESISAEYTLLMLSIQ